MTPRIERMLKRAERRRGCFWRRRRWVAEVFAETQRLPVPVLKARALERVLRRMPVRIAEDELIVGYHPESVPPRDAPPVPSLKPSQDLLRLPEERAALRAGVFTSGAKTGHLTADYPRLLSEGFGGILRRVEEQLDECPNDQERVEREAMAVSLRSASTFILRYARLAGRLADKHEGSRAAELWTVAAACRHVAHHPPRNLHEALQLLWFAYLIQCIEEGESTAAFALGRFDQYLLPFWNAELRAGRKRGELLELIACFWAKLNEFSGLQVLNLTLGGSHADGRDAVNDLSYACLEVMDWMRRAIPSLSVRWHPGIDREFFRRAVRLAVSGFGQPAFYNDTAAIKAMTNAAVAPDDAADVVPGGCVELGVQGCCYPWVGNFFNLPKCLELALHNGMDPGTGERVGLPTGAPEELETFDKLLDAYEAQVGYLLDLMGRSENTTDRLEATRNPYPFLSALVADCIERGKDITAGGARYNFTEVQGIGIAHVVDSLLNVRRLEQWSAGVMECCIGGNSASQHSNTPILQLPEGLSSLVGKLDSDFADDEDLRRRLQTMRPAYGDAAEETASLARRIVHGFFDRVERHTNPRGGSFRPGLLVWTLYDQWADCVGALPDGRKRGEALVSSIGPRGAAGIETPTSILLDVTSFDHFRCAGGLALNLRFDGHSVASESGIEALMDLMETYFSRSGLQVQINVIDSALLRKAQTHPEAFGSLVVRVSGFCTRFVTLGKRMQEEIVARAELRTSA